MLIHTEEVARKVGSKQEAKPENIENTATGPDVETNEKPSEETKGDNEIKKVSGQQ